MGKSLAVIKALAAAICHDDKQQMNGGARF
jgi:hypothetical protein